MIIGQFTRNNPQIDLEELTLGDGSRTRFAIHEVIVLWDAEERVVPAYAGDGALVGVELLRGSVAIFEFVVGGSVTIEPAG